MFWNVKCVLMVYFFTYYLQQIELNTKNVKTQTNLRNKSEGLGCKRHQTDPQDRDTKALSSRSPYSLSLSFITTNSGNVDKILCTKYITFYTAFTSTFLTHRILPTSILATVHCVLLLHRLIILHCKLLTRILGNVPYTIHVDHILN